MKNDDRWLERWLPLIAERANRTPILELGCGDGRDSIVLAAAGLQLVGIDRSPAQIAKARLAAPNGEFHCIDFREPLPFKADDFGVIVASLALHYFAWEETLRLIGSIRTLLRPGGILLCRVNSTNDHNYGASGHPALAANYYAVAGEPKRFFDRRSIAELFAQGWTTLSLEEHTIDRYARAKIVWEIILERD